MSAASWPPFTTVTYSGGKVSAASSATACAQAGALALTFSTAVLPPAIAAASTPSDKSTGKLNGLMMRQVP